MTNYTIKLLLIVRYKFGYTVPNKRKTVRMNGHITNRSENTGKFLLRDLAALTNSIYCKSQHGALMNRFPVMITPIGWKEFPTTF